MKKLSLVSPLLAAVLTLTAPAIAFAHVGHGDEFQGKGGIERVKVNATTDKQLGIEVNAITPATGGGKEVLIPITALVDADGKQLVFVQYKNFYEPVPVKTGATKGDLIEITEGLSVGEQLVTQGSLTLYAESRKTKPTNATTADANVSKDTASKDTDATNPEAPKQDKTSSNKDEFPIMQVLIGGGILAAAGGIIFAATRGNGN
jgi:membrane fusion protein, cation efflux system